MGIKRDVVCTVCGFVVCVCAAAPLVEALHPHQRGSRTAITREVKALPPEQDHTHREYDRAARIVDVVKYAVTTSSEPPPGNNFTLEQAARIARQNFQRQWRVSPGLIFTSDTSDIVLPEP